MATVHLTFGYRCDNSCNVSVVVPSAKHSTSWLKHVNTGTSCRYDVEGFLDGSVERFAMYLNLTDTCISGGQGFESSNLFGCIKSTV